MYLGITAILEASEEANYHIISQMAEDETKNVTLTPKSLFQNYATFITFLVHIEIIVVETRGLHEAVLK